jgi:hypothetical protein
VWGQEQKRRQECVPQLLGPHALLPVHVLLQYARIYQGATAGNTVGSRFDNIYTDADIIATLYQLATPDACADACTARMECMAYGYPCPPPLFPRSDGDGWPSICLQL